MKILLTEKNSLKEFEEFSGPKARGLKFLKEKKLNVPFFFAISKSVFDELIDKVLVHDLLRNGPLEPEQISDQVKIVESALSNNSLYLKLVESIKYQLDEHPGTTYWAVRSSATEEDSINSSHAGMYESFLFCRGLNNIISAVIKCWLSTFTKRVLDYKKDNKLGPNEYSMSVIIQHMIDSEVSGVAFSKHPIEAANRKTLLIESVYGQCEGLVSGQLEPDRYEIDIVTQSIKKEIGKKEFKFIHGPRNDGVKKVSVAPEQMTASSLTSSQLKSLSHIVKKLEKSSLFPIDVEWSLAQGVFYILQIRPITNLPPLSYYSNKSNGDTAKLWDNSNIIESFSGVTTPLTFSLVKEAYEIVYTQTCETLLIPKRAIKANKDSLSNMLGLIRGRVYYNLINWYKVLFLLPGIKNNKEFMETMMGVKESLDDKYKELFNFTSTAINYTFTEKFFLISGLLYRFVTIDKTIKQFKENFNNFYAQYSAIDFNSLSPHEIKAYFENWNKHITNKWKAPILNDILVMIFFGVLKKLITKWVSKNQNVEGVQNLQNDLLCGEGGLDSTLPAITLMQMAKKIDSNKATAQLISQTKARELSESYLKNDLPKELQADIANYIKEFGHRCDNEQKLEEEDLHTNPDFIFEGLKGYLESKKYSAQDLSKRELELRNRAQDIVFKELSFVKSLIFKWVLSQTRKSVKNRENLRFLRSKSFGITRRIFRALSLRMEEQQVVEKKADAYYLTYREIFDYIDGTSESLNYSEIAKLRKEEYAQFKGENDPPERFITFGTVGTSFRYQSVIGSGDLSKNLYRESSDPNTFYGTPCCPGKKVAHVVVADTVQEATNLKGKILLAKRTDPGWVSLFSQCEGLIVERGSLLSHSAVIARELGIPTIIGVSPKLALKLKSLESAKIELNATSGEIRIISL